MATRIAILSDVHVPGPGRAADLFLQAVERIKTLQCDSVVLLGDTVENGFPDEYALVRSIIEPLRSMTCPMVGNHELLKGTVADFRAAWIAEPFGADLIENLPVMRLNSAIAAQPESDYFGTVDENQLAVLQATLDARSDKPAILFSHHPLARTVRRSDEKNLMIDNSQALSAQLQRHGATTVMFSGHTHAQSFYRSKSFAAVGCPPLGYWPHAFAIAEINRDGMTFETQQLIESPDKSFDPQAHDEEYRTMNQGTAADRSGVIQF